MEYVDVFDVMLDWIGNPPAPQEEEVCYHCGNVFFKHELKYIRVSEGQRDYVTVPFCEDCLGVVEDRGYCYE